MATALMAWLRAPAPTTWTSTAPAWRTAPAMAPATELGFDRVETLSVSIVRPPIRAVRPRPLAWRIRRRRSAFLRSDRRMSGIGRSVVERDRARLVAVSRG